MLKGTATIELTDVKTGQKEVVKHDNLVTNAVNDLLTLNPDGYLWDAKYNFANNMLPICPNAIGGILLYQDALEEDPTKYYAQDTNPLVGYSSNDVGADADSKRGSMNQTESGPLEDGNGYRFVFDFATSQANGTISGLGLTSKYGGASGYGSSQVYDSAVIRLSEAEISFVSTTYRLQWNPTKYETVVGLSDDGRFGYFAFVSEQNTVSVGKIRLHLSDISLILNTKPRTASIVETHAIVTQTFAGSEAKSASYRFYNFMDGGDGYIWGFEHANGANGNSVSPATLNWIKISKEDFSFTEGTISVNAALQNMGLASNELMQYLYEDLRGTSIIHNGHLYCVNYGKTGIVKINLKNPADIKEILHPTESIIIPTIYGREGSATTFNVVGNVLYFGNGYIVNDEIVPITYSNIKSGDYSSGGTYPAGLRDGKTLGVRVGPFLIQYLAYGYSSTYKVYRRVLLMTPYLATINNLDTPVTKTADKTMKITYILREE